MTLQTEKTNLISLRKVVFLSLVLVISPTLIHAQYRAISSRVTSLDDESAIPGINVILKDSNQGTVTNIDGYDKIKVGLDRILMFSFLRITNNLNIML
jgi:hypothetical protein